MKHHRQRTDRVSRASNKLAAQPQVPRTQHWPSENRHAATWKTTKALPLDSFSNSKTASKTTREATTKTQNKTQQKTKETEPQASHSRTRHVHSAKPDVTDTAKSIHEQNPKQISDQKPKNTTITQRPVESLLGLSEPKHLGIEKIEI